MRGERGVTLVRVLALLLVAALVLGASLPAVSSWVRGARLRRATFEMVSAIRLLRHRAIAEGRSLGLVFRPVGDDWSYALHADGDGDGIRTADIRRGRDPRIGRPRRLSSRHVGVRPGFLALPRLPRIPPARGYLAPLRDPVRFGNTDIIACSATGRCSSGTLYLTDRHEGQWAVVLYGVTGRMRVMRYDPRGERWRR